MQDLVSYSFVDSISHCIEDGQGDVILTNCNAGNMTLSIYAFTDKLCFNFSNAIYIVK